MLEHWLWLSSTGLDSIRRAFRLSRIYSQPTAVEMLWLSFAADDAMTLFALEVLEESHDI